MWRLLGLLVLVSGSALAAQAPGPLGAARAELSAALKPMGRKPYRIPESGWQIPPDAGAIGPGRALPPPASAWNNLFVYGETGEVHLHVYQPPLMDSRTAWQTAAAARAARFDPPVEPEATSINVRHGTMAADIRRPGSGADEGTDLLLMARSTDGWLVKLLVQRRAPRAVALEEATALLDRIALPPGVRWEAPPRTPFPACEPFVADGALRAAPRLTEEERFANTIVLQFVMDLGGVSLDGPNWCSLGTMTTSRGLPMLLLRSPRSDEGDHLWKATLGDGGASVSLMPDALARVRGAKGAVWNLDSLWHFGAIRLARLEGQADDAAFRAQLEALDTLLFERKTPPLLEVARPRGK